MGKLALAAALILLGGPASERDIVWLKDGRKVSGIIVAETERMPDATRRRLIRKYQGFRERRSHRAEALAKMETRRVTFMGQTGLQTFGAHFKVVSTCEDAFVKDVTYYLDEVFAAYKECFAIQRNADRRIDVFVLSDMEEYTRFQRARIGSAIQNPAFYHLGKNFIAACNLVRKEEAAAIRKQMLKLEGEIKEQLKRVKDQETKVRREMIQFKKKVRMTADTARRKIRGDLYGNKNARLRKVDKWEREELGRGEKWERERKKELDAYRKKADDAIAHNRKIIARNHRLLLDQNKRMFEGLFHEGFHAFARNFLWWRGTGPAVPRWLDEGLASYYEMSAVDAGELVHGAAHPMLLALVQEASREGKLLPTASVLRGGPTQFLVAHRSQTDRSNLYYAQSWALAHYMVGRIPRERMQAYVVAVAAGVDSVKAFEAMMGRPLRQVEVAVRHHVADLE
ncbi:MAG: DUF1570 domain-containing protein [Planctomycetota bacterium]|jgi:hypothetical protein